MRSKITLRTLLLSQLGSRITEAASLNRKAAASKSLIVRNLSFLPSRTDELSKSLTNNSSKSRTSSPASASKTQIKANRVAILLCSGILAIA